VCSPRVSCGAAAACFAGTRLAGTFWRPCSHHGTAEGILFGSGLSLVGGPNDRCGTQNQSPGNDVSAPIVARGSSPTRPPPPSLLVQCAASHHRRASSAQLARAHSHPRAGARRAKLGIVVYFKEEPFAQRGVIAAAQNQQRASERSRPGRRGVSSEGAAGASAAARQRGAASRKATLQARAPEEDIPRRPGAMGQEGSMWGAHRLDRRVQCDRLNPICRADTESSCVVGQTSQPRGAERFARVMNEIA